MRVALVPDGLGYSVNRLDQGIRVERVTNVNKDIDQFPCNLLQLNGTCSASLFVPYLDKPEATMKRLFIFPEPKHKCINNTHITNAWVRIAHTMRCIL